MSNLPVGKENTLRYIPQVPQKDALARAPGGMYVSAKSGVNMPIGAAAQVPGQFEYQKWKFGESADDGVQILFVPLAEEAAANDTATVGFHNSSEAPGTPVELGVPSRYRIEVKAEVYGGKIVIIRPVGNLVGKEYCIGIGSGNHLEILEFPVGTTEGLPGWFFRG